MKKNVLSFVSGMIAMLMLVGLPVTALAASGAIRIEVSPISVLVDGKVFQPKDANGNDVMVFTYNGTTYAPLRALAEAYGLEVGYDGERHIATVSKQPTQTQAPIVDTGYRRMGIAYKTLDMLVSDTKCKGITSISLEATAMGRSLYEKYGFVKMNDEMELPE